MISKSACSFERNKTVAFGAASSVCMPAEIPKQCLHQGIQENLRLSPKSINPASSSAEQGLCFCYIEELSDVWLLAHRVSGYSQPPAKHIIQKARSKHTSPRVCHHHSDTKGHHYVILAFRGKGGYCLFLDVVGVSYAKLFFFL